MHKEGGAKFRQHNVRPSRQILAMQPEPETHRMQSAPHPNLRLRIA
jgi:hypothetical protein